MNSVIIVDFGVGNLRSVQKMFERVGTRAVISSDADVIASAERLVLPGVGHFGSTVAAFRQSGLEQPLRHAVCSKGSALLGVCVGAQMLMTHGDEGDVSGLDLIPGRVIRFDFSALDAHAREMRIPHMGWRSLELIQASPLFPTGTTPRFYFTHSFHPKPAIDTDTLALARYGYDFAAAFGRGRVWGVQFHPEKSHVFGMDLLTRFSTA